MTLRARLVAGFTVLLLVAVGITGVVATSAVRATLTAQVEESLHEVARRGTEIDLRTLVRGGDVFPRNVAVVVIGPEGRVLRSTPSGFGDAPDPLPDVSNLAHTRAGFSTLPADDGSFDYLVAITRPTDTAAVVWASPLREVDRAVDLVARVLIIAGAVVLILGVAATWWTVRRGMRPVDRMVATAGAIASGATGRRIDAPSAKTELGRLGRALNEMLNQIEAAKASDRESQDRLRRFVSDASHELRTPITAIGGYAELYRQGGLPTAEDVGRAMGRIEAESTRMHRLVEDLLLLARMDEGSPIRRERVDLGRLVADGVADHRAVDPTRPVSLVAPEGIVVSGDPQALAQVVANLLANTRVHTPEGTTVVVDVRHQDGRAVLEVSDDGPGLADGDHARVFERFARGDRSRSRSSGGAGLGLSIAATIVRGHGGSIDADQAPQGGFRVTVGLPAVGSVSSAG